MKAKIYWSEPRRSRESLRSIENWAASIRKKLRAVEQQRVRRLRGIVDDALQLTETIEQLARYGQSVSAEDAVEIKFQIELLRSLLEGEIDRICAS
jgi:hypothetical protein